MAFSVIMATPSDMEIVAITKKVGAHITQNYDLIRILFLLKKRKSAKNKQQMNINFGYSNETIISQNTMELVTNSSTQQTGHKTMPFSFRCYTQKTKSQTRC